MTRTIYNLEKRNDGTSAVFSITSITVIIYIYIYIYILKFKNNLQLCLFKDHVIEVYKKYNINVILKILASLPKDHEV